MGPGDNLNPGVYFLIGSGTPGVYTRSGVYLDPALKRSYTVCMYVVPFICEQACAYNFQIHTYVRTYIYQYLEQHLGLDWVPFQY